MARQVRPWSIQPDSSLALRARPTDEASTSEFHQGQRSSLTKSPNVWLQSLPFLPLSIECLANRGDHVRLLGSSPTCILVYNKRSRLAGEERRAQYEDAQGVAVPSGGGHEQLDRGMRGPVAPSYHIGGSGRHYTRRVQPYSISERRQPPCHREPLGALLHEKTAEAFEDRVQKLLTPAPLQQHV